MNNTANITETNSSISALYFQGMRLLQASEFVQADECFDKVLKLDPEYAAAYIGKVCAWHNVTSEAMLAELDKPLHDDVNFKSAVRCANPVQRTTYISYNNAILVRIKGAENAEEERKQREELARREELRRTHEMKVADAMTKSVYDEMVEKVREFNVTTDLNKINSIYLRELARTFREYGEYFDNSGYYSEAEKWAGICENIAKSIEEKENKREFRDGIIFGAVTLLIIAFSVLMISLA